MPFTSFIGANLFQSTLPVWGATSFKIYVNHLHSISIHAPRVGSDLTWQHWKEFMGEFQSTLPVWGATGTPHNHFTTSAISIHAPRVGSDIFFCL